MPDWPRQHNDAGCTAAPCGLPAGFFRVRYFENKQMRLTDYVDEQQYHGGKRRFHNQRLHGAGILCGLRVSALEDRSLVLRVARGAALDDCGREIVVGWDQCVDVGAWFKHQKHLPRDNGHNLCKPDAERRIGVCVLLRHAECSGSPEPAPRSRCRTAASGCSCGGGSGCSCGGGAATLCGEKVEYGRVSEEFELRLAFSEEARHLGAHALFPDPAAIDAALAQAHGGVGLLQALAEPVREHCPGGGEGWLVLACFDLVFDEEDDEQVRELADIDHRCASQVLLSTEVLQHLVAGLAAEVEPGLGGPALRRIHFRHVGEQRYQFVLELTAPVAEASVDVDSSFDLRQLARGGWSHPASNALSTVYKPKRQEPQDLDAPAIYITVDNDCGAFLRPGGRYQLYTPAGADPVVDELLRPLRPRQLMWRFAIERGEGGDLVMKPLAARGVHHG